MVFPLVYRFLVMNPNLAHKSRRHLNSKYLSYFPFDPSRPLLSQGQTLPGGKPGKEEAAGIVWGRRGGLPLPPPPPLIPSWVELRLVP